MTDYARVFHERERLRATLLKLIDAYITENKHPECQPGYRFRVRLAIDMETWTDDLGKARRMVLEKAGIDPAEVGL